MQNGFFRHDFMTMCLQGVQLTHAQGQGVLYKRAHKKAKTMNMMKADESSSSSSLPLHRFMVAKALEATAPFRGTRLLGGEKP